MVRIALLNFAFFLVGLGLGVAFCTWGNGKERALEAPPAAPAVAESAAAKDGGLAEEAAPLPRESAVQLADVLAALPVPKVESGNGTIKGTVKLEDGSPVSGVVVRAWPQPRDRGGPRKRFTGVPVDEPLEQYVASMVAQRERNRLARVEATSDTTGAFVLSGLADSDYSLQAFLRGYEVQRSTREGWRPVKPGSDVEFVAKLVTEITVAVVFADGKSPAEASIEWQVQAGGGSHSSSLPWSPENPAIELNPGTYKLRASSGKDGEYASEQREVTLKAGEQPEPVTLTLKGRPGIKGVVKFPKGEEPDNANVLLARVAPGGAPDWESLRQSGDNRQWVGRHNEYAFAFKDLAAGTYAIGAMRGHDAPVAAVEEVEVTDALVVRDLVMPALDPADYVVVWVYGPENELIRDAQISGALRSKNGSSSGGGTTVARPDGSYWFLAPEEPEHMRSSRESGEELQCFVSVHTQRFGTKEVQYEPKKGAEVVVRFVVPAELEVVVPNYAGSGFEGKVNVAVEKPAKDARRGGQSFGYGRDKVDFEGKKTLGPMEPGEYEIVLYIQAERSGQRPVARQPVTLAPGKNSASISIPPLYTVTVIVPDATPNMHLELQPLRRQEGYWGGGQQVNKEGRTTFTSISPGEYRLRTWGGSGPEEMRINVQGDMEVRFEPKTMNALQVTIGEEEGLLTQVGFQDGDLIIGIDGKEIENLAQIQAAMFTSAERVTLMVQRGGKTVELSVEPRKMIEAGNSGKGMGGEIEPTSR